MSHAVSKCSVSSEERELLLAEVVKASESRWAGGASCRTGVCCAEREGTEQQTRLVPGPVKCRWHNISTAQCAFGFLYGERGQNLLLNFYDIS